MKNIKSILLTSVIGITSLAFSSCTKDLAEINKNPNSPEIAPTNMIFNGANRVLFDNTRDGWWMARMSMPWMQYSAQSNYVEEDKYAYRDNQTTNGWIFLYRVANNYKDLIEKCEDPATVVQMEQYGPLKNQIAISRIMLAYVFDNLVTHFGDVPYWSYGQKDNPNFQALNIDKYLTPAYAKQQEIYADLLKELKEAANQLDVSAGGFVSGDNIYKPAGNTAQWKKFANSLRLRIANRIKKVYPAAVEEMRDAVDSGVFTSNEDNAIHKSGATNLEGNPLWKTFFVDNRTDFFVNKTFIDLLKGTVGNFGVDPRLEKISAPNGISWAKYKEGYDDNDTLKYYTGIPNGLPQVENYYTQPANVNFFSRDILKATRGEVLMEYAEVAFILSEMNNWSHTDYIKGVKANLDRLGVSAAASANYIAKLPPANQRNVMTQKYIALFFNPDEAWNEYRRTGYPDTEILLMPGETGTRPQNNTTYVFTPLQSGNVIAKDLPARVRYPFTQQTLNPDNWKKASTELGGDEIDKKLWFAK
ncbi:SusD/RagB family nutrient-binding outer membrane lipoprotein [Sphingobacterium sp. BN32]|uniref:SusD/RagB family nutrient-binding outer membrane lipoprotein n=1 Tax=Sphingobacterium sp. BN32 TaxID=3058432 RepID=UPI00265CCAA3|nr:SusD/RagB family nutrient-binding outer membrane lipoprotein [Sphingobacterium sp. BN32]WKK57029.1 SusD/RagB family nutrient-binding outer membrane lipoprotein [Sphingobacterium sp. BN32]